MPENIRRAGRSFSLGLTVLAFVVVLGVLITAQFIAAAAAGLIGPAPLMVVALQTIGGTVLLLLTSKPEASVGAGTPVARTAVLRISIAVAMATTFVIGHRLPFGYGIALALAGCTIYWFWYSVPAEHDSSLLRFAVLLLIGMGVLLLSDPWHHVLGSEGVASASLCGICISILTEIARRKARAGHDSAFPAFGWMALTVLAVPVLTAHDPTWATLLLAGFAFVTGLLWVCLITLLAHLRKARSQPTSSAMVRSVPVLAPVLATTAELFGLAQWMTPLNVAGIILVCMAASAGWAVRPTRR
ncbi:hypothetical protein ACRYCC_13220 [Actinomadura scrupuli]|uniref:hypothetical protein n=1 Tax=Actinomadura scrupuli TaxID=559629 RepID=UPI003D97A976